MNGVLAIGGPSKELRTQWDKWRHEWVRINRLRLQPWRVDVYRRRYGVDAYILKHPLANEDVEVEILPCRCPLYPDFAWDYICSDWDFIPHPPVVEDEEEGLSSLDESSDEREESLNRMPAKRKFPGMGVEEEREE